MQGKRKYKVELVDIFLIVVLLFLIVLMLCTKGINLLPQKEETSHEKGIITKRDMPLDYNTKNTTVSVSILDGNKKYSSNQWYSNLNIVFESDYTVKRFEWYHNGVWESLCNDSSYCEITIIESMNQNVKFRAINYNDKVSFSSNDFMMKIDNTLPTCNITANNNNGSTIITVSGSDKESGVYGIQTSASNYETGAIKQFKVSKKGTYTFHVKDNAGNENECEFVFNGSSTNNSTGNQTSSVAPSMTISTNGGSYLITNGAKKEISFQIHFNGSNLNYITSYGWSNSETVKPTSWTKFSKETFTFRFAGGNYYFWVKLEMNNGKVYYYRTKPFVLNYQITLDNQNGEENIILTKKMNQTLAMPKVAPSKNGYTFLGWNTSKDGTGDYYQVGSSYALNEGKVLYAIWKQVETVTGYVITFNSNGGNFVSSKTVTVGKPYGSLPIPERNGYVFLGWYLPNGEKVVASSIVTLNGNTTLTAKWEERIVTYVISFDSKGGTSHSSKTVMNGKTYGTLPLPYRNGYTFLGWYLSNGTKITADSIVALNSDITLMAKWQKNQNVSVSNLYQPSVSNPIIVCSEHSTNCKSYLTGGNVYYAKQYPHMEIYNISSSIDDDIISFKISYTIYSGIYGTYNQNVKTRMYLTSYQKNKMISSNIYLLRDGQKWGTGVEGKNTVVNSGIVTLKVPVSSVDNNDMINTIIYTSNGNGYVNRYSFVSPYLFRVTK